MADDDGTGLDGGNIDRDGALICTDTTDDEDRGTDDGGCGASRDWVHSRCASSRDNMVCCSRTLGNHGLMPRGADCIDMPVL